MENSFYGTFFLKQEEPDLSIVLQPTEDSYYRSYTMVMDKENFPNLASELKIKDRMGEPVRDVSEWLADESADGGQEVFFQVDEKDIQGTIDKFAVEPPCENDQEPSLNAKYILDIVENITLEDDMYINEELFTKGSKLSFYHSGILREGN